jgi:hypothetical protein
LLGFGSTAGGAREVEIFSITPEASEDDDEASAFDEVAELKARGLDRGTILNGVYSLSIPGPSPAVAPTASSTDRYIPWVLV